MILVTHHGNHAMLRSPNTKKNPASIRRVRLSQILSGVGLARQVLLQSVFPTFGADYDPTKVFSDRLHSAGPISGSKPVGTKNDPLTRSGDLVDEQFTGNRCSCRYSGAVGLRFPKTDIVPTPDTHNPCAVRCRLN